MQLTNQARQRISDFKWEELGEEDKLTATEVSGEAMVPIAHEHFPPLSHALERPVLDPISLRMDPELLAVEDPEVHGDSGLWASADPDVIEQKRIAEIKKLQEEKLEEDRTRARDRDEEVRDRRRSASRVPRP